MEETARQRIQEYLDSQKTQEERNILGQFSTPFPLAMDIMRHLRGYVDTEELALLEPAIGTGVFYSAFREVFGGDIPHKALGFEIDGHYFKPAEELWKGTPLRMRQADFLAEEPHREFTLLIANPPYTRHHHIDCHRKKELQQEVLRQTGVKLSGLAGLYCYFLLLSSRWLKPNALSCWLIPSEFMDVNYGQAIKEYLLKQVDLLQIHRFDPESLKFSDALVTSSVVIFRNSKPGGQPIVFSYGDKLSVPSRQVSYSRSELSCHEKWTPLFEHHGPEESGPVLGEFFQVKRGIATGDNDFFMVREDIIDKYHIPEDFLDPILPSPRYLAEDIIDNVDGLPKLPHRLFLFSCNLTVSDLQRRYPLVLDYIRAGKEKGVADGYICSRRTPWYSCEKRKPPMFLVPYMGRERKDGQLFRFILNNSCAMATNGYLLLYPKPDYEACLSHPEVRLRIWRELNSIPKDKLMNSGRVYGGGLHKLEPKELMKAPAGGIAKILNQLSCQQELNLAF